MSKSIYHGRKQPYTEIGISRVPCVRCGKPSVHQWQICANDNRYLTVCRECDIELNRIALEFARIPNVAELLEKYSGGETCGDGCWKCRTELPGIGFALTIGKPLCCPKCGKVECSKADDHRNDCTGDADYVE